MSNDKNPKICPMLNKPCIRDRCNFWTKVDFQRPGAIAGIVQVGKIEGCTFTVQIFLAGLKGGEA